MISESGPSPVLQEAVLKLAVAALYPNLATPDLGYTGR